MFAWCLRDLVERAHSCHRSRLALDYSGLALGLAGALGLTRVMKRVLFRHHPLRHCDVRLLLGAVALRQVSSRFCASHVSILRSATSNVLSFDFEEDPLRYFWRVTGQKQRPDLSCRANHQWPGPIATFSNYRLFTSPMALRLPREVARAPRSCSQKPRNRRWKTLVERQRW